MKQDNTIYQRGARMLLLAMTGGLLVGCGKEEIKVYSAPKEPARVAKPPEAQAGHSHQDSHPVHWTTPSDWKELAPTDLRVGNFLVTKDGKKAEVSIIPFPGRVGTELANVNRWRGEIGLGPIAESEVSSQPVVIGQSNGKLYDLSGSASNTVAAILEKGDTSWFFKMRGDKEVVTASKPVFVEFLKSIAFHSDHAEHSEQPAAAKPASPDVNKAPEPDSSGEPKWDAPANWKEKPPSEMVLKNFTVGEADHEAKISITAFPGAVGGLLMNVNRWRGQLSLPPIAEPDLSKLTTSIDVLGGKATLVEMNGTDGKTGKPARMIAATVPRQEKTWFYKMMGDETTVAREKEAFLKFVETVRY